MIHPLCLIGFHKEPKTMIHCTLAMEVLFLDYHIRRLIRCARCGEYHFNWKLWHWTAREWGFHWNYYWHLPRIELQNGSILLYDKKGNIRKRIYLYAPQDYRTYKMAKLAKKREKATREHERMIHNAKELRKH